MKRYTTFTFYPYLFQKWDFLERWKQEVIYQDQHVALCLFVTSVIRTQQQNDIEISVSFLQQDLLYDITADSHTCYRS